MANGSKKSRGERAATQIAQGTTVVFRILNNISHVANMESFQESELKSTRSKLDQGAKGPGKHSGKRCTEM